MIKDFNKTVTDGRNALFQQNLTNSQNHIADGLNQTTTELKRIDLDLKAQRKDFSKQFEDSRKTETKLAIRGWVQFSISITVSILSLIISFIALFR